MRYLRILFTLCLGMPILANAQDFTSKHTRAISMRVLSDDKGIIKEEKDISCTPQTCCFKEKFQCHMDNGKCLCDIHYCKEGVDQKEYWIEISGTLAATHCINPRLIHETTGLLCVCDSDQTPFCGECNPPPNEEHHVPSYPSK